jgi:SAM-dependent methyltransferase
MSASNIYVGRDLEAMEFAEKYHRWILETFRPYMGKRLVEVGAGAGSFSQMLLDLPFESLTLVEPSENMYQLLEQRISNSARISRVSTYNAAFQNVAGAIKRAQKPDSIIYVNVLEHIEDDEAELELVHSTLGHEGRVFIFVPAFRWLFGPLDERVGHFRRYTQPELEAKCRRAGFKIVSTKYFDLAGVLPWWIKYRLLKSDSLETQSVKAYDRYVVPVTKMLEALISPPLGKNIVLIAEKI